MKTFFFLSILFSFVTSSSCSSSISMAENSNTKNIISKESARIDGIIANAKLHSEVKYQFGGTPRTGMDCSGLVYKAFQMKYVLLPRTVGGMARSGKKIKLKYIKKGDLLFFRTPKKKSRINHVELVTCVKNKTIYFIHATNKKGVITSSLSELYWKKSLTEARRML